MRSTLLVFAHKGVARYLAFMNNTFESTINRSWRRVLPFRPAMMVRHLSKSCTRSHWTQTAFFLEKGIRLWARQRGEGDTYENWMSVIGRQLGSHTIVIFHGEDTGVGSWTCTKDRESTCQHILQAQRELQDTLEMDGGHIEEWHGLYPAKGKLLGLLCPG